MLTLVHDKESVRLISIFAGKVMNWQFVFTVNLVGAAGGRFIFIMGGIMMRVGKLETLVGTSVGSGCAEVG